MIRKRAMIIITILTAMSLLCTACGKSESSVEKVESESSSVTETIPDSSVIESVSGVPVNESVGQSQKDAYDHLEVVRAARFREGKALIKFKDTVQGGEYIGIIDTDGNLGSFFSRDNSFGNMDDQHLYWGYSNMADMYDAEFENGYIYLYHYGNMYLIDRDGNILTSYMAGETICFGGGYFMLESHVSNFDENKYIYSIVDKDGNELDKFETSQQMEYNSYGYCGGGVFVYNYWKPENQQYVSRIVFAKTGQVLEQELTFNPRDVLCADENVVYFSDYADDLGKYAFAYSDLDGNWKTVVFPEEYQGGSVGAPVICALANGRVLFRKGDDYYFIYDIHTEEFIKYEGKYADSLGWMSSNQKELQGYGIGSDGTMVIQLEGKDGKSYVGLIDKDMNEVCEPIYMGKYFSFDDDLIYVHRKDNGVDVYDLKGNRVFVSDGETGFPCFSEGFAVITDPDTKERSYITMDWKEAFKVNYSTGKMVF